MKRQFVTYDIALKLKELGFNEECIGFYYLYESKEHFLISTVYNTNSSWEDKISMSAPLWQQVVDWLREKHDIVIDIARIHNNSDNYHFAINLQWEYHEGDYHQAREQAILKAIERIKN